MDVMKTIKTTMEIPVIIGITEKEINFTFPDLSVCKKVYLDSEGDILNAQFIRDAESFPS